MLQVWIVARLALIREGLRGILASEKDFEVSAPEQASGRSLVQEIVDERPDLVLLDVDMLEHVGWGIVRDLAQLTPGVVQLVIGDTFDDRRVLRALSLGARGYLLRETSPREMVAAVRAAGEGLFVIDPLVSAPLLDALESRSAPRSTGPFTATDENDSEADLIEPLSERELEVLRLMVRGLANKQIAAQLYISEHTVKFHIRAILGKLGAANRTEAVTLALQRGLVSL